ncbi:MAG: hypothetical protein ACI8TX_001847 [Hyphomicrobiaceae bacterium]|jgi:uncharacterized protein YdbL (DUF1318 family)
MIRRLSVAAPVLVILGAVACVTVNIYFPAPAIRDAAEEIAEETWGEGNPALQGPAAMLPGVANWVASALAPGDAFAAEPDINVSTAAIRALKQAMSERAVALKPSVAAGNVGVAFDGSLAVRDFAGVALGDQAKVRRLIDAENRDRKALYREIAEANNLGADRTADVQNIFAETWSEQARRSGWWSQNSKGSWVAP